MFLFNDVWIIAQSLFCKHTRINIDLDMIALESREYVQQQHDLDGSHLPSNRQSAPPHHMPPGTYWLFVGAWLTTSAVITAVGLSLFIDDDGGSW